MSTKEFHKGYITVLNKYSPSLPFQFQALVTHMVRSRIISGPSTYSMGRKAEPIPCKHEHNA